MKTTNMNRLDLTLNAFYDFMFYLHQRPNYFQFLDINRLHPDPFLSDGLGEVLFLEPDLCLGFPFLVGDEGNITAIYRNKYYSNTPEPSLPPTHLCQC